MVSRAQHVKINEEYLIVLFSEDILSKNVSK